VFWLTLDKDNRKEIDEQWVLADCLVYLSFISILFSIFYAIISILDIMDIPSAITKITNVNLTQSHFMDSSNINLRLFYIAIVILLWILSRFFYVMSLSHHVKNGGYYRAIFDLNRDMVRDKLIIQESDFVFWDQTWAYLQYRLIKCDKCNKYIQKDLVKDSICETCSKEESS
jgi:hypothetical protein